MRWNCPHCHAGLAIRDRDPDPKDRTASGWRLSTCYKCGGFSMVQAGGSSATPQPRVLSGRRGSTTTETIRALPASSLSPQGVPPPVPREAYFRAVPQTQQEAHKAVSPAPIRTHLARSTDIDEPADFSRLRAKWNANKRSQNKPTAPLAASNMRSQMVRPKISRWAPALLLVFAVNLTGWLLVQQGKKLENTLTQQAELATDNAVEFSDEIALKRAAPTRNRSKTEMEQANTSSISRAE
jgi:hypothetical protein